MIAPSASRLTALCLFVILGAYFAIGAQYAALTPPWQVPDEPAHYNYVRHVATTGTFPVLQPGDYNQAYLSELTSAGFPPDRPVDSLRYEGHQPPLYYLLAAPVFAATGGALLPLRLFSLALGAGAIVFIFLTVREMFRAPALALTAAGLAAFVPQHIAMMSGVNNDSLAGLAITATLWLALKRPAAQGNGEPTPWRLRIGSRTLYFAPWSVGLGLLIGAALLTKATAYVAAPAAALALWLRGRREGWPARRLMSTLAAVFAPALALGAVWWGRNLAVYGWPDLLGLARHDLVIEGQPRTAEWIALFGLGGYLERLAATTFRSFWGQFGWMGVVMDARVYWALLAFSLFVLAGCALAVRQARTGGGWTRAQRDGLTVLTASGLLTSALYAYYNLELVQHQGRYLFPALLPLATWAALGLRAWARVAEERLRAGDAAAPPAWSEWLPLAGAGLLAVLAVLALYWFIVPGLTAY